jgi:hypothetical protein
MSQVPMRHTYIRIRNCKQPTGNDASNRKQEYRRTVLAEEILKWIPVIQNRRHLYNENVTEALARKEP